MSITSVARSESNSYRRIFPAAAPATGQREKGQQLAQISGGREEVGVAKHHQFSGALSDPAIDRTRETRLIPHLEDPDPWVGSGLTYRRADVLGRVVVQDHDLNRAGRALGRRAATPKEIGVPVGGDQDAHARREGRRSGMLARP